MAMAAQEEEEEEQVMKWEGKATAKLKGVRAEQVWPLILEDFCSVHKWLPTIDSCYLVEGVNGQPGLVRYCASSPTKSSSPLDNRAAINDDDDKESKKNTELLTKWCHEKLIAVDPVVSCLSYEVLDNNLGITSCISTIKVTPTETDDEQYYGCEIQWSFLADPIEGLMYDSFSSYINLALQGMAENMERALQSS